VLAVLCHEPGAALPKTGGKKLARSVPMDRRWGRPGATKRRRPGRTKWSWPAAARS